MKKSRFILLLGIIIATCLLPVGKADWSALKKSNTLVASSSTAVCYIGNTKFTTLDDALYYAEANNENDKIYVIPGLNPKISGLTISNDHTISEGDSLVLPIAIGEKGITVLDEAGTNDGEFADNDEATNLKTRITLAANKTLTINGTLEIGAVTGSKSGIMGQASGAYCELLMGSGSSLEVNGALNCWGFIKENANGTSTITINNGGSIKTPAVFYDHVDATTSAVINANEVFPYEKFDIPQIRPAMTFYYGSSLIGRVHIYGSNVKHRTADANLIGVTASFINMESADDSTGEEGTKLIWQFVDTSNDTETSASFNKHKSNITVYGKQSFGSIAVTIFITIDSKDYYLPIPCGYSISVESSATFTLPSDIKGAKFMPGSSLECKSGATINFNAGILFYQGTESSDKSANITSAYPDGVKPAVCLNNGTMNINAGFEGDITTSNSNSGGASVVFGTDYKPITDSKESTSKSVYNWGGAFGKIKGPDDTNPRDKEFFLSDNAYTSDVSTTNEYFWNGAVKAEEKEETKKDIERVNISYFDEKKSEFISISTGQKTFTYDGASNGVIFQAEIDPDTNDCTDVTYAWILKDSKDTAITDENEGKAETVADYENRIKVTLPKNDDTKSQVTYKLKVTVSFTNSIGESDNVENEVKIILDEKCLLPTAKILMADGTYTQAGLIKTGDMVISFNHKTGRFEPNRIIGNDDIGRQAETYNVVHLEFSNGKSTDFIYEHGYFDKTLNKYVYLHEDDFIDYAGHNFVFYVNGLVSTAKLIGGSINEVFTTLASPATANHLNLIVDDMLSIGGGLDGLFNIFEYDPDTLAFDKEKMNADIAEYGLLGYESFEKYFPKEIYDLLPCKYLGVSIGKGLITWDIFEGYVNKWKDQLMENLL